MCQELMEIMKPKFDAAVAEAVDAAMAEAVGAAVAEAKEMAFNDGIDEKGIKVLRYSNLEIHRNFKGVCEDILLHCNERTPSTTAIAVPLPPKGEC